MARNIISADLPNGAALPVLLDRVANLISYEAAGPESLAVELDVTVADAYLIGQAAMLRAGWLAAAVTE